ncbi:MAG: hypothetical protein IKS54_08205 [Erysipelotrichaceae bacterium]|nr:hypothetical protein [Erysipelotrichaceae bacterium]
MKKLFKILLAIMMVLNLCACSATVSDKNEEEIQETNDPEYYGIWKLVKLEDLTGEYDDELMEQVLEDMRSQNADFILNIFDDSTISNGNVSEALIFDFDRMTVTDESGESGPFTYENGQIAFDISNKYHCVFEKQE